MCGRWIASLIFSVCAIYAQQKPAFEVASVRPAAPLDQAKIAVLIKSGGKLPVGPHVDSRRAEYLYMTLHNLVEVAWGVQPYQVEGPDWMAVERFDIVATLPPGASKKDAPKMLQSLLEDRFGLVAHQATVERPVLGLLVGKGGLKLKKSSGTPVPIDEKSPLAPGELTVDGHDGQIRIRIDAAKNSSLMNYGSKGMVTRSDNPFTRSVHLEFSMATMNGLAEMLSGVFTQLPGGIGRQIVDMTGTDGYYDATLDVALSDMSAAPKSGETDNAPEANKALPLTEAVQELGLKLESRTAPVSQFIIDHVEKTPTGN
ncbi:MAG TPA: TIGR03435 family protein [Bryobacteraceae bacterium]|jgi:uncharacterized protein (TIGR03435 family)